MNQTLPSISIIFIVLATLLLAGLIVYVISDYFHHRSPLKQADPEVRYSFGHHLKVVTIPLIRYRVGIRIEKVVGSDKVRRF